MTKNSMMAALVSHRRFFLAGASAFTLSACSGLIGPPEAVPIYILNPVVPTPPPGAKVSWSLAVGIPSASEALSSERIVLTRTGTTLDFYANATWPDSLPLLVQTAVLSAFQESGRIPAVTRGQDALHADYDLALDIREFTAHYSDPEGAPNVTVQIIAQMATSHGRKVVSSLAASQSAPASANSVDAVVQAMDTALAAVISQILGWAVTLPVPTSP